MKILLINQDWFAAELRDLGHEVVTFGTAPHLEVTQVLAIPSVDQIVASLPNGFVPDALIVHDDSAPLHISGLNTSSIPSIYYSVDTHHHAALHKYLAHMFDVTLVAQKDYLSLFDAANTSVQWMPLWASRTVEASMQKQHQAVFVGTMDATLNPDRVRFFDALREKAPLLCTQGEWWRVFPFAEIVVNQTVKGDLNFRVFEAMMCGACLLTERSSNGLLDLFKPDEHLLLYDHGDVEGAARAISSALANPARMRAIAEAGRNEILRAHLPRHRALRIHELLSGLKRRPGPLRHAAAMRNFCNVGYSLFRRELRGASAQALVIALAAAELMIADREPLDRELGCHLATGAVLADMLVGDGCGERILERACQAYPQEPLYGLARLRQLLNRGCRSEAMTLAQNLSTGTPEATFEIAERVVRELLSKVSNLPG